MEVQKSAKRPSAGANVLKALRITNVIYSSSWTTSLRRQIQILAIPICRFVWIVERQVVKAQKAIEISKAPPFRFKRAIANPIHIARALSFLTTPGLYTLSFSFSIFVIYVSFTICWSDAIILNQSASLSDTIRLTKAQDNAQDKH